MWPGTSPRRSSPDRAFRRQRDSPLRSFVYEHPAAIRSPELRIGQLLLHALVEGHAVGQGARRCHETVQFRLKSPKDRSAGRVRDEVLSLLRVVGDVEELGLVPVWSSRSGRVPNVLPSLGPDASDVGSVGELLFIVVV